MDDFLTTLTSSIPLIIFCIVVWVLVNLQRRLLEKVVFPWLNAKYNKNFGKGNFYQELALPSAPIGTSIILILSISTFPLPSFLVFLPGLMGKIFVGIFLGLISGWVYRIVRKYFLQKIGTVTPEEVKSAEPTIDLAEENKSVEESKDTDKPTVLMDENK